MSELKILCIDTALSTCSVALKIDGSVCFSENTKHNSASEQLNGLIEDVITQASIKLKNIDAVAISNGPGSYTGLRIGAATAKGLAYSLSIPIITISTLEIMTLKAVKDFSDFDFYVPNIDARRDEAYIAIYSKHLENIETAQPILLNDAFRKMINEDSKYIFFGNASEKIRQFLDTDYYQYNQEFAYNALDMISLSLEYFDNQKFADVAYFEPNYTKPFFLNEKK